jgi:transcriptional regulator of acetoin/glycerol metabolism
MAFRRPAQLIGPEHYCIALQYEIAFAAPILDNSGEAIGVLVLIQPMANLSENNFNCYYGENWSLNRNSDCRNESYEKPRMNI